MLRQDARTTRLTPTTEEDMSKAYRKRLILTANRLSMNERTKARVARGNGCFLRSTYPCARRIYKKSGRTEAHALCVKAILTEIRL